MDPKHNLLFFLSDYAKVHHNEICPKIPTILVKEKEYDAKKVLSPPPPNVCAFKDYLTSSEMGVVLSIPPPPTYGMGNK